VTDEAKDRRDVYEHLLPFLSPGLPLPSPWDALPDSPDVYGPVIDPSAAIGALSRFNADALIASGIAVANDGQPALRDAIVQDAATLIVLRDGQGRPNAILSAAGCLSTGSPSAVDAVLDDDWSRQHIREHGFLVLVSDLAELRLYRALGVAAALLPDPADVTRWLASQEGNWAEPPDAGYVDCTQQLEYEMAGLEARDASTNPDESEGGPDADSTGAPGRRAVPKDGATNPDRAPAVQSPPANPISEQPERPLLVLASGSLAGLTCAESPAVTAAIEAVIKLRRLGALALDGVRAWRPDPELCERLRYTLAHGLWRQARSFVLASLSQNVPVENLAATAEPGAPGYSEFHADLVAALAEDPAAYQHRERVAEAREAFDAYVARHLIGPLRSRALGHQNPTLRNAALACADAQALVYQLSPLTFALLAAERPDDPETAARSAAMLDRFRSAIATSTRITAELRRLEDAHW
jgi:hypothetical protein